MQGEESGKDMEEKIELTKNKKMRGIMKIQKVEEKSGRKIYESSVRIQQEEMERIPERETKDAFEYKRYIKVQEIDEREDDTNEKEICETEVTKIDIGEKEIRHEKEGENVLKENAIKLGKPEKKIGRKTVIMKDVETEEEKRKWRVLSKVDEMEAVRRGKIVEHENENVRRRRQLVQDENKNEGLKYNMMQKYNENGLNTDVFLVDKEKEREVRRERRKQEREADLRLIRDARERSDAIKKKEMGRRREESYIANNEKHGSEMNHEKSGALSSEEINDVRRQSERKTMMRINDDSVARKGSEVELIDKKDEEVGESDKADAVGNLSFHQGNDEQYNITIAVSGRDIHDDDDDESVSVTSNQSETSLAESNDINTALNRVIPIMQEDVDREIEQKINSQIIAEKISFRG